MIDTTIKIKMKTVGSTFGKLHYMKIPRVVKGKNYRKDTVQLVMTDMDLRDLYLKLHKKFGKEVENEIQITLPRGEIRPTETKYIETSDPFGI